MKNSSKQSEFLVLKFDKTSHFTVSSLQRYHNVKLSVYFIGYRNSDKYIFSFVDILNDSTAIFQNFKM